LNKAIKYFKTID